MFGMEPDVSKGKTQAGFMKKPKKKFGRFHEKVLAFSCTLYYNPFVRQRTADKNAHCEHP